MPERNLLNVRDLSVHYTNCITHFRETVGAVITGDGDVWLFGFVQRTTVRPGGEPHATIKLTLV